VGDRRLSGVALRRRSTSRSSAGSGSSGDGTPPKSGVDPRPGKRIQRASSDGAERAWQPKIENSQRAALVRAALPRWRDRTSVHHQVGGYDARLPHSADLAHLFATGSTAPTRAMSGIRRNRAREMPKLLPTCPRPRQSGPRLSGCSRTPRGKHVTDARWVVVVKQHEPVGVICVGQRACRIPRASPPAGPRLSPAAR
jgi:hypothetical protein